MRRISLCKCCLTYCLNSFWRLLYLQDLQSDVVFLMVVMWSVGLFALQCVGFNLWFISCRFVFNGIFSSMSEVCSSSLYYLCDTEVLLVRGIFVSCEGYFRAFFDVLYAEVLLVLSLMFGIPRFCLSVLWFFVVMRRFCWCIFWCFVCRSSACLFYDFVLSCRGSARAFFDVLYAEVLLVRSLTCSYYVGVLLVYFTMSLFFFKWNGMHLNITLWF